MTKGYTTEAEIENYMLTDIDPSFSAQITTWIGAMEREIDKITGRNFISDVAATARVFDGKGEQFLLIDDAVEITKVEVGQDEYGGSFTEILGTGSDRYFLEPANYSALGVPVERIALSARRFTEGKQNQRITAKWGYSASVPDDIKMACTVFVAGIINQNSSQGGESIKSERIGNYQVTYNTDQGANSFADFERAIAALDAYKKYFI